MTNLTRDILKKAAELLGLNPEEATQTELHDALCEVSSMQEAQEKFIQAKVAEFFEQKAAELTERHDAVAAEFKGLAETIEALNERLADIDERIDDINKLRDGEGIALRADLNSIAAELATLKAGRVPSHATTSDDMPPYGKGSAPSIISLEGILRKGNN